MQREKHHKRKERKMPVASLPCYGGPFDGRFYPEKSPPLGYRQFQVRGKMIWLWKAIRIERLDFGVLGRASKWTPEEYGLSDDK